MSEATFRKYVKDSGGIICNGFVWNKTSKHRVKCSRGHLLTQSYANLIHNRGIRCSKCETEDIEKELTNRVIKAGGKVLGSINYVNNKTKFNVSCPKGHTVSICRNFFSDVIPCMECRNSKISESKRLNESEVKARLRSIGVRFYKNLGYETSDSKLNVICAAGHKCSARLGDIEKKKAVPCRECSRKEAGDAKRTNYSVVKAKVEECGGELLSSYSSSSRPIQVKCPNGHINNAWWSDIRRNDRILCQQCNLDNRPKKYDTDFVRKLVKDLGGKLFKGYEYKGVTAEFSVKCVNGHKTKTNLNRLMNRSSLICRKCSESTGERKTKEALLSLLPNDVSFEIQKVIAGVTYKDSNKPAVMDFYIEHKRVKVVIEFQGEHHYWKVGDVNWWSGEVLTKENLPSRKDTNKKKMLYSRGIKLIAIPYWIKDIKSYLEKRLVKLGVL